MRKNFSIDIFLLKNKNTNLHYFMENSLKFKQIGQYNHQYLESH